MNYDMTKANRCESPGGEPNDDRCCAFCGVYEEQYPKDDKCFDGAPHVYLPVDLVAGRTKPWKRREAELRKVVLQAFAIMEADEEAAGYDAGFDAGEFSGPAHARMLEQELKELAQNAGFSDEEVWEEMNRITNEDATNYAYHRYANGGV